MHSTTRLLKSRDDWQTKAVFRQCEIRKIAKRLARRDARIEQLENAVTALKVQLDEAKEKLGTPVSTAPPVIQIDDARTVRALCVQLVVLAVVSFRSVPRILEVLNDSERALIAWVPAFTSVINWTLRLGLAKLNAIEPCPEAWIAIIDCSIDVSIKKALVVLRVGIKTLLDKGKAIELSDCECIGVEVSERWCGETVLPALDRIFAVSGLPVAIVKDQGSDLSLGVKLWRQKSADTMKVAVIEDVGHIMANALKAAYGKRKLFNDFLTTVKAGGAKLRQSDLSFLSPPKVRTKGRFQSIMNLAAWGVKILALLGGSGRAAEDSLAARLRRFLPNFGAHRTFLEEFSRTSIIVSNVLCTLKNSGLNRKTYHEVMTHLDELPKRSKVRRKMAAWLRKHIRIQCRLGIGQTPLLVSSDIIETLMGKFKVVIQRNPKAEFNRIVLAFPALCGPLSEGDVKDALEKVRHTELMKWEQKNVTDSQSKKRRHIFPHKARRKTVRTAGS